jgi:hypothetical protein
MLAWLDRAYGNPEFCEAQLIVREIREEEVVSESNGSADGV